MSLFVRAARVVPGDGSATLAEANVRIVGERIESVGDGSPAPEDIVIDARGRVLMPAFVDAHTHAVWAGDRLGEFESILADKPYPEILAEGGGILSTVRAVRAASREQLRDALLERLGVMLREGSTTVEVKSGYGLDTDNELKLLRAISDAARSFPGTIVPTALLGHAKDPTIPRFVEYVVNETLPRVHEEFPDVFVDAYCEAGAWSVDECRLLLKRALELGHPVRLHTDQFHSLGGLELALELGARSVDHLEATPVEKFGLLRNGSTFAVLLPASGFHLDDRYANGRALLDAGARLVLASNYNPGSAPTSSLPFVIALAVRKLGLTVGEAIVAVTSRAAHLLGFEDRGRVAAGQRADLILLRHRDERSLAYELGGNPVDLVIGGGRVVAMVNQRPFSFTASSRRQ